METQCVLTVDNYVARKHEKRENRQQIEKR